ncbi:uncharacterized protein A4U43_C05F14570 [Asparagus officinalis]|uniref:Uncharacterized protein n=1 Tax=Asparagus officinalis TaxID=4686 RepID=A0A5P1EX02_ASPOF|nr:uncharacterized protein A4U43_C05F14570 [Asparagus officinalis]
MVASLGKSKRIVVYIVHGVEEYVGESTNEDNEAIDGGQYDENEDVDGGKGASDEGEHDNKATDEGQGDENEANEEAKVNNSYGMNMSPLLGMKQ